MSRDVGADRRFGAPQQRDVAGVQLRSHAIGGGTGRLQRRDLGGVLAHPQVVHHGGATHVRGAVGGPVTQQLDQEARPHRVAHRCHSRPADELGNDGDRVFQLTPRPQREHVGVLGHSRGLQARDHQRGITVARYHQHRQPLQRHRLVAGEVRQIAAHGHQQGIHAGPLHAGPSALDAIEEDG